MRGYIVASELKPSDWLYWMGRYSNSGAVLLTAMNRSDNEALSYLALQGGGCVVKNRQIDDHSPLCGTNSGVVSIGRTVVTRAAHLADGALQCLFLVRH